jgi:hypothetical protein
MTNPTLFFFSAPRLGPPPLAAKNIRWRDSSVADLPVFKAQSRPSRPISRRSHSSCINRRCATPIPGVRLSAVEETNSHRDGDSVKLQNVLGVQTHQKNRFRAVGALSFWSLFSAKARFGSPGAATFLTIGPWLMLASILLNKYV